MIQYYFTNI